MYIDYAITQTAYAYDILSRLAFMETRSERYMTICKSVAMLRHAVAQKIYQECIDIDSVRFDYFDTDDYKKFFERVQKNENQLLHILRDVTFEGGIDVYVRDHIYNTGMLVESCHDYFYIKNVDRLYCETYICHDCGRISTSSAVCACGSQSIDRIDMI